jgi:NADH-quinone oxidoreductase subunit J
MLEFLFYLFASLLVFSALAVITARNPVHAVLFLIFAFFNAAGIFLLTGAEFLAMLLVIVYVGAVAVLFLFVVMMLDVDFIAMKRGLRAFLPLGLGIGGLLLAELILVFNYWPDVTPAASSAVDAGVTNTHALGAVLYTDYILAFQGAGLILLTAMIGAIVLTLRSKNGRVLRQSIAAQVGRKASETLEIKKVGFGEGVDVP